MAVYVSLQDELEEQSQSGNNGLSVSRPVNSNKTESKMYAILLALALVINTIIVILIASNTIAKNINEPVMKIDDHTYLKELSDLFDRQLLSDDSLDFISTPSIIESNESTTIELNDERYMSFDFNDETDISHDEISQEQIDD